MELSDKVIAIDGKTSRRSFDGDNKPMHLVSAFASELGITLWQLKTAEKSNEITAIPELIELLDVTGSIVTIDAMGCQAKIVETIVSKGADYLIGLKGNQGTLSEDVCLYFERKIRKANFFTVSEGDKGYGRIETRVCTVTEDIEWLKELHPKWEKLKSIIEIKSEREIKSNISTETRHYISSLQAKPDKILNAIRQHWE